MSNPVLKSVLSGRKTRLMTFFKISRLWICCSFVAVVIPWPVKWSIGGTGRWATTMFE
jgi:hypothetical protein